MSDRDWLREHGNDLVEVKLIDLLCLVARLEEATAEPWFEAYGVACARIWSCDLPRLKAYLPPRALEELR